MFTFVKMTRPKAPAQESSWLISSNMHLTEYALEAYCLNLLRQERLVAEVEEHLLCCTYCQLSLEKTQVYVDASRHAAKLVREKEINIDRQGRFRIHSSLATAAAAVFALMLFHPGQDVQHGMPLPVKLVSVRSNGAVEISAKRKVEFLPDISGLEEHGALQYQLANSNGERVAIGVLSTAKSIVHEDGLSAGKYWLRVMDSSGQLVLREFAVVVK
jgi:hypothetical protein